jgi:hypothetical protein
MSQIDAFKNIIKMALDDPDESREWKSLLRSINGFNESVEMFKLNTTQLRLIAQSIGDLKNEIIEIKQVMVQLAENMEAIANVFTSTATNAIEQLGLATPENPPQ